LKQVLQNQRWVSTPSDHFGEDWAQKAAKIDAILPLYGLDLAQEEVFLLFDRSPGALLTGEGQCLVARPVLGPKRSLGEGLELRDWVAAGVYISPLKEETWEALSSELIGCWEQLQREGKRLKAPFMLRFTRRLEPQLSLERVAIFLE
jgi:hypothetical protein